MNLLAVLVLLTWTHPAVNVDGSALPLASIASTVVQYGACSGAGAFGQSATVPAPAASAQIDLGPGSYCFRALTVTTAGKQSAFSNVAMKTVPPAEAPPPLPPGLTVGDSARLAYTFVRTRDNMAAQAVGTVAPGTECMPEGFIADGKLYRAVPRASVTFAGSVQPEAVFAECPG